MFEKLLGSEGSRTEKRRGLLQSAIRTDHQDGPRLIRLLEQLLDKVIRLASVSGVEHPPGLDAREQTRELLEFDRIAMPRAAVAHERDLAFGVAAGGEQRQEVPNLAPTSGSPPGRERVRHVVGVDEKHGEGAMPKGDIFVDPGKRCVFAGTIGSDIPPLGNGVPDRWRRRPRPPQSPQRS